jgi:hypothetical protein
MGTIKEIFKEHGPSYLDKYRENMPANHRKTINAIIHCKTDILGTVVYQCDDCKAYYHIPLSCGNRHCPNCQHQKSKKWLAKQVNADVYLYPKFNHRCCWIDVWQKVLTRVQFQ